MTIPDPTGIIHHLVVRGMRTSRGVAAVEFAMLAPVLITLFLGVVDGARAMLEASRAFRRCIRWTAVYREQHEQHHGKRRQHDTGVVHC
jgi:hypothetical protein